MSTSEVSVGGSGEIVKRTLIGALQQTSKGVLIVALIIGKTEPRRVVMRKDGGERFVSSFTLRDSPSDIINLTLWTSREEADEYQEKFKIGSIIDLIKPRVINRDFGSDQEKYSPVATSPFQLGNIEGKTIITEHLGDWSRFQSLLSIPTKPSAGYFSISDILECKKLVGRNVDLCVAVRSVGPVKIFKGRDGEERKVRDVKLFDLTAPCIVMKVWDMNLIGLSDSWIPRETILFLADIKVSFDEWRGCNSVSCTGKTIITQNPEIGEAKILANHCQTADFSSYSRMDALVANINPSTISQVHNVFSLMDELNKVYQDKEGMLLTNLYGYITMLDIDQAQVPTTSRCGCCTMPYRPDEGTGHPCCTNIDCKEYRSFGVSGSDFMELSDANRTSFKWELFLVPLKLSLAIILPTLDRRNPIICIVHISPVGSEEICSKMPSPVFQ
ncbi:meiosis-specific with OB domain-containing protein isoform X2 [Eurytemora carolleeae]|uniref:meiosis-specific with OB domain-containing protein isoform X2 n=1 Tax=Eurytemora carolleeae TaxID=1294199 RepID=UPI000C772B03|nr:meiosis-specific with OB domain-containing protein isoform X2 [Eurytemora carolleeae]|eukprot:XP_023321096.1 meiosis-specific with OB domain-containing protein-like isoform X2 [Eurytemora affinis]